MRYIIKRRLLIRAEARWVKMFAAAERPRSIVLPMQLNRAPCGSMCDRALWICPLFTVFLWQAGRLKEWHSEVQAKNKVLPFLWRWNRSDPPGVWRRPTLLSSITTAQWCTIKNGGEHVKKDELCHLSLLRSVFDLFGPTLDSARGDYVMMTFVCDHQDQTEKGGIVTEFLWQSSFKSQQTDLP